MRRILTAAVFAAAALALPVAASAQITVTAGANEGTHIDRLEGANVISTSPILEGFSAQDAFGAVTSNPPYEESLAGGHVIFTDGGTASIDFRTAAPTTFSSISYLLSGDEPSNPGFRSFGSVSLFAGATANSLALIGTASPIPGASTVTFGFDPAVYQFFRFEGTQPNGGGRILEIEGIGVPEPSTWAMMILGLGFAGAALRRRRAVARAAFA